MLQQPDICLQIRLHNPIETPKVAQFGFLIAPGEEYRVVIRPIISNASSSLRRIPENKRQCVFSDERYLKFYHTYTQRNCVLECEANYTLATCMCVPYYLPSRLTLFFFCKRFKTKKGFLNNKRTELFSLIFWGILSNEMLLAFSFDEISVIQTILHILM